MQSTIIHGDCLEIMSFFPDNCVHHIICDLPYAVTTNKNDKQVDFVSMWKEIKRILKPGGNVVFFGQSLFFCRLCLSNEKWYRYDIVWNKHLTSGFLNAKRMPLRQHEQIAIFYEKLTTYNPQFTKGKPNNPKGTKHLEVEPKNNNYGQFKSIDVKLTDDKYPKTIVEFSKVPNSKSIHRTQKPIELMEYLVSTYSNEGETILDFTCGSGTTLLAAKNLNRKFIGIEINEEDYNIAVERLQIS